MHTCDDLVASLCNISTCQCAQKKRLRDSCISRVPVPSSVPSLFRHNFSIFFEEIIVHDGVGVVVAAAVGRGGARDTNIFPRVYASPASSARFPGVLGAHM